MERQSITQGTSYLLIAQTILILSGYMIHIGLGRLLGPTEYGIYGVIIYLATVFNFILITGLPQATSKYTSEDSTNTIRVLRTSFVSSMLLGIIIFLIIFVVSEEIALLLHDVSLTPYVRLISLMIPSYAILTVIEGYYNGKRNYRAQSGLILLYNIIKPAMIFAFVLMGFSIWGAVLGFTISPIIPLAIGLYMIRGQNIWRSKGFPFEKILRFAIPIIIFSAAINLIISLDLFFVKRIMMNNELAGYYSAASTISKVPYFLMGAVNLSLFPAVSANMHNSAKIQEYISESLRYTLHFVFPVTAIIAASPGSLVSLLYSDIYLPAGQPLRALIVGIGLFSIFSVLTTVITATGKPKVAMILSIFILAADLLLNMIMVPVWGMIGAAGATTISCGVGMALAAIYVYRSFGILTYTISGIKILSASAILYAILFRANLEGIYLLLGYSTLVMIYLALLYLMGEITERDITRFKSLIPVRIMK